MLEAALLPRKLASNFLIFLTFVLHFVLDLGPNLVSEPECITAPAGKKLRFHSKISNNFYTAVPVPFPKH
jgi:hypothetical protein